MRFFDFSTSGQDAQGRLKVFSVQFCWHFGFALLRALSYKKDPDRLVSRAACLGNYTFSIGRINCHRFRVATKAVRSSSSVTVENLLRSTAVQLPAPGGAPSWPATRQRPPNAGSDEHPRDFSSYAVPLRAWDGYPLLRGKPFHRPPGQTFLEDKAQIGTPRTQVWKSRPPSSVPTRCLLVRLHVTWAQSLSGRGAGVEQQTAHQNLFLLPD